MVDAGKERETVVCLSPIPFSLPYPIIVLSLVVPI